MSALRLLGVLLGVVGIGLLLLRRRQGRLLGKLELFAFFGALGVVAIGLAPGLVNGLTTLTGFTGELSRITSLLVFATLGMFGWVLFLQGQLGENRHRFLTFLRNHAAERVEGLAGPPPEVVVVMPALNEAENLQAVLQAAPKEIDGHTLRFVVVDDGSEDDTAAVAIGGGALCVRTPINVGGGHALQVGFRVAQKLGARWVVTMDADGQHRFEDLPTVLAPLFANQADVVIGSRRLGVSVGHEAVRALGLRIFNGVISFLTGRPITDCSSGFRGFDLAKLLRLKLVQDRHHTAELIIEAARQKLRIIEVPIVIQPRLHGESKKGTNWRYGVRFARTVVVSWWRS